MPRLVPVQKRRTLPQTWSIILRLAGGPFHMIRVVSRDPHNIILRDWSAMSWRRQRVTEWRQRVRQWPDWLTDSHDCKNLCRHSVTLCRHWFVARHAMTRWTCSVSLENYHLSKIIKRKSQQIAEQIATDCRTSWSLSCTSAANRKTLYPSHWGPYGTVLLVRSSAS